MSLVSRFNWTDSPHLAARALLLPRMHRRPAHRDSAAAREAKACDESCLKGLVDTYLDALSKHQPSLVPTAPRYRHTENGARTPSGEALWVTFNSFGKYRHHVADPQTGGTATLFRWWKTTSYLSPTCLRSV